MKGAGVDDCCMCESVCVCVCVSLCFEPVCACMGNNKALRGQEYEILISPLSKFKVSPRHRGSFLSFFSPQSDRQTKKDRPTDGRTDSQVHKKVRTTESQATGGKLIPALLSPASPQVDE